MARRSPAAHLALELIIHLPGGLPMGQAGDLDTAKAELKAAWKALEARDHTEAAGNGLQGR